MKDRTWDDVLWQLSAVIAAYDSLLEETDKLSDLIGYDAIRTVFPSTSCARRDTKRIRSAIERMKPGFDKWRAELEAKSQRSKLLADLALTDEQIKLLGIKV
jgi:hypothetical protein